MINKMIRNDLFNKDWAIKPLHEVVTFLITSGNPIKASERVEGEIPYYGANGIQSYVNDYIFNDMKNTFEKRTVAISYWRQDKTIKYNSWEILG